MSYEGIVCSIEVRPHPNADKLSLATANGFQIIVSKDTPNKAVGVFFMSDTQLSHNLCMNAVLYRKHPETGEELGGYLEPNRRVKSLKLRGEISEGLWLPIERLDYLGIDLKVGTLIGTIKDEVIAQKYIPQHIKDRISKPKAAKAVDIEFPSFLKHYDTSQLRMNLGKFRKGSLVIITEKLHGTSARSGNLIREEKLSPPWWAFWMRPKLQKRYERVYGSRNVAFYGEKLPVSSNPDSHEETLATNYRWLAHQSLSLHQGETVYYEIVGWETEATPIMPRHNLGTSDQVHKDIRKDYDTEHVTYSYGCPPGEFELYVYRITMTSPDGHVTELSWDQIIGRCGQLGVKHVPEIDRFIMGEGVVDNEMLLVNCARWSRGKSLLGNHIREGICARVSSSMVDESFKYKGFEFCHLEGISKQDETYIDTEDIS